MRVSKMMDLCGRMLPASFADRPSPPNDHLAQALPFGSFEVNPVLPDPISVYPLVLFFRQFIPISALSGFELLVKTVIPFRQAVPLGQTNLAVGNRVANLHPACCALVAIFGLFIGFNHPASHCLWMVAGESLRRLRVNHGAIPAAFRKLHLSSDGT